MEVLGIYLMVFLCWAVFWPERCGSWLAEIRKAYDAKMKEK